MKLHKANRFLSMIYMDANFDNYTMPVKLKNRTLFEAEKIMYRRVGKDLIFSVNLSRFYRRSRLRKNGEGK